MHPKKQNSSITKAKKNALRPLLKTDDSRALVKYVGALRVSSIVKGQSEGSELMVAIGHLRNRYSSLIDAVKNNPDDKSLKDDLAYVERKGKALREQYDALNVQPTLSELNAQSEDDLTADITLLLIDLDETFNIGKGLSVPQIEHLSMIMTQRYGSLTLDDIALCFHRAKCGDYGEVYDRLDLNVITVWLNQYLNERKTLIASAAQNQHLATKHGMSYDPTDRTSTVNVSRERGINTDNETHYQAYKSELLTKKKE